VEEWTLSEVGSTGLRSIRGGSYKNVQGGMTCSYDFFSGPESGFSMDQLGFRCCKGTAGGADPIDECEMAIDTIKNHPFNFNVDGDTVCSLSGWTLFDDWEIGDIGDSNQDPPDNSCHIGTNLDGDYSDNGNNDALSPWIDLTGCETDGVTLHYSMYRDLQGDDDHFYVDVWDDNAGDWHELYDTGAGATSAWTDYTLTVPAAQISGTFRIRFRLYVSWNGDDPGIYLDNVYLTAN
jgi:hypothetical protein